MNPTVWTIHIPCYTLNHALNLTSAIVNPQFRIRRVKTAADHCATGRSPQPSEQIYDDVSYELGLCRTDCFLFLDTITPDRSRRYAFIQSLMRVRYMTTKAT